MTNRMFDINGDQRPDLLWWWLDYEQWRAPSSPEIQSPWLLGPGHLAHWISSPDGYDWSYTGPVGGYWWAEGHGNFGGNDGGADILFVNQVTGDLGFWNMRNGAVQEWVSLGDTGGWTLVGNHGTDFSGDGWDDILFVDRATGTVGYREMRDGVAVGWTELGVADGYQNIRAGFWNIVGTGDYANDGAADVFWYSITTGATGLWSNDGSGAAQWVSLGVVDDAWELARLDADYTGDGADDVLWFTQTGSGEVDVGAWDLSSGQAAWTYIGRATAGWEVISAGDFTGDGAADVVFQNVATGDVGYWELDAGAVYAGWTAIGRDDNAADFWEVLG